LIALWLVGPAPPRQLVGSSSATPAAGGVLSAEDALILMGDNGGAGTRP
jgi:hypothetical protein